MSCNHHNLVSRYHDGELPATQRQAFADHLADCAECSAELEQLRTMSRVLRAEPRPHASADFLARLESLADHIEDVTVIRFVRRLTAAAAAILVGATVLWSLRAPVQPPPLAVNHSTLPVDEQMLVDPASAAKRAVPDNNILIADNQDPVSAEIVGGQP